MQTLGRLAHSRSVGSPSPVLALAPQRDPSPAHHSQLFLNQYSAPSSCSPLQGCTHPCQEQGEAPSSSQAKHSGQGKVTWRAASPLWGPGAALRHSCVPVSPEGPRAVSPGPQGGAQGAEPPQDQRRPLGIHPWLLEVFPIQLC